MKTVEIIETFTGYPSGAKRSFAAGETVEVPNDFADLIIQKGHAREAKAAAPARAEKGEAK